MEQSGLLISGQWLDADTWIPVFDKYSGETVAKVCLASPDHVRNAVTAAVGAVEGSRQLSARRRAELLHTAADLLASRRTSVIDSYVAETGFTIRDAETELRRTCQTLHLCAEEALRIVGEIIPVASTDGSEDRLAFTLRVPVGAVGAITPFNAPLNTVAHKLGPALAAGNAVVLKPAQVTPLSSINICMALQDAGFPPGYVNLVVGPGSVTGRALVRDSRIRYFTFTGSTKVGLSVKQNSGICKTHLELGSNSPSIVCADADIPRAAELIVRAGYRKAGQVCTSVQRVLADRAVCAELQGALVDRVKTLIVGDPHVSSTDVGPMIDKLEAARATKWVSEAVDAGGRLLTGGSAVGPVMEPTVVSDAPDTTRLMREEIFAPVVCLKTVSGLEEAIDAANSTPYGLQAGIFTRDLDMAMAAAKRLHVGGVIINDTSSYHADLMPYGGVKDSGYGLEGPRYAVAEMTDSRIVVIKSSALLT